MKTAAQTILNGDRKITNRILVVSTQLLNKISIPVFNLLTSLLVVNLYSKKLWGEYVFYSLIAMVVVTIVSWGSQDYLLRQFTKTPAEVARTWASNTVSRSLILAIIIIPVAYFLEGPTETKLIFLFYALSLVIYRSFDVLIIFFRRFLIAVLLEISGFLVIIICILATKNIDINDLLLIFTLATWLKLLPLGWIYVVQTKLRNVPLNIASLIESFPFFLPSFIGLIQSRVDLYMIAAFLDKDDLATYQIYISLLSMIHQGALLLLSPYIKNLYRFTEAKIVRLAWKFFLWGIAFSAIAIPVIFIAQKYLYHVALKGIDYVIGFLILLPLFFYSIKTYAWFKMGKQYNVALVNAIMAAVALGLSIFLIREHGITGGLLASAISQWTGFSIFVLKK